MHYHFLGHTDIEVSPICFGTMTWGEQNTQGEAFIQMDFALSLGINFWDTAELYSIPPKADTYGRTEQIIGRWIQWSGKRHNIVLASKIAGPSNFSTHIRGGQTRFNKQHIHAALEGSLKRLRTDYLDLYQLHWPERPANFFGQLGYNAKETEQEWTSIEETLSILSELVQEGKIRSIGLSNETPWGTMKFLQVAEQMGLEKIVTVQNPYSLLNRSYEVGLAEISHRENVGLLAYSPLGFGMLSGKYLNGNMPKNSRLALFQEYTRYSSPNAIKATERYCQLAQDHDLTPAQLALAFVNSRPFTAATSVEQLKENIGSIEIELSTEVLEQIEHIHNLYTIPSP